MGTVLELSNLKLPARAQGRTSTVLARTTPAEAEPESAWLTAIIRPAGTFGSNDASRLRLLLDTLSACASIVVLDLQAARLRSQRAGQVIEDAACDIERRGGSLLCINVSAESRACLSAAGNHAVLMEDLEHSAGKSLTSSRPSQFP